MKMKPSHYSDYAVLIGATRASFPSSYLGMPTLYALHEVWQYCHEYITSGAYKTGDPKAEFRSVVDCHYGKK